MTEKEEAACRKLDEAVKRYQREVKALRDVLPCKKLACLSITLFPTPDEISKTAHREMVVGDKETLLFSWSLLGLSLMEQLPLSIEGMMAALKAAKIVMAEDEDDDEEEEGDIPSNNNDWATLLSKVADTFKGKE